MMAEVRWPASTHDVLGAFPFHNDLVRKLASFAENKHVQWVIQIVMIDDRDVERVFAFQRHCASGLLIEEDDAQGEGVLIVFRKVSQVLRAAIKLQIRVFNVRL